MDFKKLGHTCVVGMHWGDEGKGKIVDMLAEHYDIIVRYNGGGNAGHTVVIGDEKYAFHLLPVGVLNEGKFAVVGPGVALDVGRMLEEIETLAERGITVGDNLKISDRAHLVMPWHKKQDLLSEASLGKKKIGTTARGIGPCYADKMQRATAIRVIDLLNTEVLRDKIAGIADFKNTVFSAVYGDTEPFGAQMIIEEYKDYAERIANNVCNTTQFFHESMQAGKCLLFEGANGTLLDIDHGTFPFVTSSSTCAVGVPAGAGVPARTVQTNIGVTKAYTTRVGAGPFPSELEDEIGQCIRDRGHEYGTTTGRPRRCGWFDAVAAQYSAQLSGLTHVAVMHLDTLTGLEKIGICTGYQNADGPIPGFITDSSALEQAQPIVEYLPGWKEEIRKARSINDLPQAARDYVDRLESLIGVPIAIVSVGPERTQTLIRA
ncbi:MAG: adenylosuccinate synthase [Planctomycetota bacterium]|nr:MAG: adenylosuccinate synthase [Planctomycetota bacterium]